MGRLLTRYTKGRGEYVRIIEDFRVPFGSRLKGKFVLEKLAHKEHPAKQMRRSPSMQKTT